MIGCRGSFSGRSTTSACRRALPHPSGIRNSRVYPNTTTCRNNPPTQTVRRPRRDLSSTPYSAQRAANLLNPLRPGYTAYLVSALLPPRTISPPAKQTAWNWPRSHPPRLAGQASTLAGWHSCLPSFPPLPESGHAPLAASPFVSSCGVTLRPVGQASACAMLQPRNSWLPFAL
jgi:hypothetical protein